MITTKEAAEKWNISPRRVAKLASEGRIKGAKLAGHSWIIPEEADKPDDAREKADKEESFVFPNILTSICFQNPVDKLNPEEKELYNVFIKYEAGDFESGLDDSLALFNKTKNIFIKVGALYSCCFFYVILRKYNKAKQAVISLCYECSKIHTHRTEITLLLNDIFFYFEKNESYRINIPAVSPENYTDFIFSYLAFQSVIQEIANVKENSSINFSVHELNIARLEHEGYEFFAMFYHFYLSALYGYEQMAKEEKFHIKKTIDIAVKNNMYTSISGVIAYSPARLFEVLKEYPKKVREKFTSLTELCCSTFAEYIEYAGKGTQLSKLTLEDFKIISHCIKNDQITDIARQEGISISKAKHLLVKLYEKLGVSKKSEIIEKMYSVML